MDLDEYAEWMLVLFFGFIALLFQRDEVLKGHSFTIMIFAAASAAIYYPQHFIQICVWNGHDLKPKDFARIMQMPKGVIIGVACHYTVMPLTG